MVKTTKPQRRAIYRKFRQSADGSPNYRAFRRRVEAGHDCLMLKWCGMWLGIEPDGYTHS